MIDHFQVVAPDLPGHGESDKPLDVDYDLELFVGFLEELLADLGLATINLAVHDIGGMVGLAFAARHPEMVSRLVVMDTAPYVRWPLLNRVVVAMARSHRFSRRLASPAGFRWALRSLCVHRREVITREEAERFRAAWRGNEGAEVLRALVAQPAHRLTEPRENLRRITMPTLILWAEKDRVFPPSLAHRLQRDLPRATVAIIPDCGHFLQLERPAEVTRHMLDFLTPGSAHSAAVAV